MIRRVLAVTLLTVAFALGTWVAWWMVPLVAFLWATLPPARPAVLPAGLAAALAWALWLCFDTVAGSGGLGRLAARLSGVMQLPSPVLILVTLLLPAVLAASAAAIGEGFAAALASRRGVDSR